MPARSGLVQWGC